MTKKLFFFICIILLLFFEVINLNAQIANNWAFGNRGGLTFNTEPPTSFVSGMGFYRSDTIYTYAINSSSISDCKGDLLFYTNGCVVLNRAHKILTNEKFN